MTQLPISNYSKEWLEQHHYTLSDFQIASLIWNASWTIGRKLEALLALGQQTSDPDLKEQISQRISYETDVAAAFSKNDGSFFYAVLAGYNDEVRGHFGSLETAFKFAADRAGLWLDGTGGFRVEKYLIVNDNTAPLPATPISFNPNLFGTNEAPQPGPATYEGEPVSGATYTKEGILIYCWSNELSAFQGVWDSRRFENSFIPWPNPFERGDLVCLEKENCLGVVETSQADWQSFLQSVSDGLYAEACDASIIVEFLDHASGEISHSHICPLFLQPADHWPDEGDQHVMEALSFFMQGRETADSFMHIYQVNKDLKGRRQ